MFDDYVIVGKNITTMEAITVCEIAVRIQQELCEQVDDKHEELEKSKIYRHTS